MSRLFRKLAEAILALQWVVLLLYLLATLLFAFAFKSLKIDPSTEALFAKNTPEYHFYQDFKRHFGSDHLVAIAVETADYLTLTNLRLTDVLTRVLSSDNRVDRVVSLTNALNIKHKALGVKIEPMIEGLFEGEKSIEEFRAEALANPFVQGNLLSRDGKVGAILVRLKVKPQDPGFLKGYIGELRDLLKNFPWRGARFYMAGSPVEQYDLVDYIRRDQAFFVPAVGLFLVLATFLIYRNFANVVVAMSVVFMTLIWTFGTVALLGRPLDLINSLLAPVVMIVSVTSVIYVINLFSELHPHHPSLRESICLTVEHLGLPCLLTSATIMSGFLSLLLNPVPAVQSFGLFASLGTFYAYVVTMGLTPLLLPLLPFKNGWRTDSQRRLFTHTVIFYLENIEFHLKWFLLGGTLFLLIFAGIGIRKIRVDTNLIRDLPANSPLAVATHFIDERLTGVYSLGISVSRTDDKSLVSLRTFRKLERLIEFLEGQAEITKVNSLVTLVKKVHEARAGDPTGFRVPEEESTLQTYLEKMAESDNPDFWSFISRDFRHLRLEARMKAVGTERGRAMEDRIWDYLKKNWGPKYEIKITGSVFLLGRMAERLVDNQIESLGLAFLVILGLIVIFFRSWKMGLLAAIPNLIPMAGLYALMGFLGVELSTPTAMISSVVLGLVVDASIQFLYRFRYEFRHRGHYLQALHHTYRNVGQAMVVTTMILVFGFASSIFASFRPTIYFGLLTSLTILFSLVCTLVLLPLVLVLLKPFGPSRVFHPSRNRGATVGAGLAGAQRGTGSNAS